MISAVKHWTERLSRYYESDRRRRPRMIANNLQATLCSPVGAFSATVLDASRHGVRVWCERSWPLGSLAFLKFPQFGVMRFAHVRHCAVADDGYVLGLEFRKQ